MGSFEGKKTVLIDASVILRYLLGDDEELYQRAEELFDAVATGELKVFIPTLAVAEVVYTLEKLYGVNRKLIAGALLELMRFRNVLTENKQLLLRTLELYDATDMDFSECLLCAYSKYYDLLSFDPKLEKCTAGGMDKSS